MSEENYILLKEADDQGKIELLDGSKWEVNPGDISISCLWVPTTRIQVQEHDDSVYGYVLVSLEDNSKVRARKIV